jgi:uncharacterized protein DUF1735
MPMLWFKIKVGSNHYVFKKILKMRSKMKRLNNFLIAILAAILTLSSCQYDDYDVKFVYTSVYFANQEYNRNIVVGEGLELKTGVQFGGLINNPTERIVKYVIDPGLVPVGKTILPVNYYTLGNPTDIIIPAGVAQGYLTITFDSLAFLADPVSLTGEYVLPLRITDAVSIDSINEVKDYNVMSISYWAKQHGYYYYHGTSVKSQASVEISSEHYESLSNETDGVRELKTVGATELQMMSALKGPDPSIGVYSLIVDVPTKGGGAVSITSAAESVEVVTPNGTSSYDEASKTFILNYAYSSAGFDYVVADTLTFRNRIRDLQADGQGVNEWRGF